MNESNNTKTSSNGKGERTFGSLAWILDCIILRAHVLLSTCFSVSFCFPDESSSVKALLSAAIELFNGTGDNGDARLFAEALPSLVGSDDPEMMVQRQYSRCFPNSSSLPKRAIATVVKLGQDGEVLQLAVKFINECKPPVAKINPHDVVGQDRGTLQLAGKDINKCKPPAAKINHRDAVGPTTTKEPNAGDEILHKEVDYQSNKEEIESLSYSGSESNSATTADDKTATPPRETMKQLLLVKDGIGLKETENSESEGNRSGQHQNQTTTDYVREDTGVEDEEEEEEKETDTVAISLLGDITRDGGATENSSAGDSAC